MKKFMLLVFIIFVILLSACTCNNSSTNLQTYPGKKVYSDVSVETIKFFDPEENVLCYLMKGSYMGGISCIQVNNH